jgi:UDP-N-acetylbacillosamine N-acetyltransferase
MPLVSLYFGLLSPHFPISCSHSLFLFLLVNTFVYNKEKVAKLSIIGAGGHCKSLITLLEDQGIAIEGIYDDDLNAPKVLFEYPVKGRPAGIPSNSSIVVAVGNNAYRENLFTYFQERIFTPNLIHSRAYVAPRTKLGKANQIFAGAIINANAVTGDNNIINTGCIIEHDCIIGSHNHIAIGAIISGGVNIGDNCFIGAGAIIINNISICNGVTIGAKATVIRNITEPGVYVGSPAGRLR